MADRRKGRSGRPPRGFKRKLVQLAAFGFTNSHPGNLAAGRLYRGAWKNFCAPGLNCYSCPAAGLSCPIGALQAVTGSIKFDFSFYIVGFLLAVGVLLGRFVCGWLCPFGLLQELLHKLPGPKRKLPRPLKGVKYAVLVVFVLLMPVLAVNFMGMGQPAFCQYLCPAGTLEGGIPLLLANPELRALTGPLFTWKALVLAVTVLGCVVVQRFFCKLLCPLGAIYGLLNRVSLYRLRVDGERCVLCGECARACPMEVDPVRTADSCECIRCGKCAAACPRGAIRLGFKAGREKAGGVRKWGI